VGTFFASVANPFAKSISDSDAFNEGTKGTIIVPACIHAYLTPPTSFCKVTENTASI
jgi:hypothetical protein